MRSFVSPDDPDRSIAYQCDLLGLPRSSFYSQPSPVKEQDLEIMWKIDELFMEWPYYGARRMKVELNKAGFRIGRLHTGTLMKRMGISPVYLKRLTSKPCPGHKIYPYLLCGVPITRVNQVWSADITYIRLKRGFVYLVAIIDWYSRYVLAWRICTTLESAFCCAALREALAKYGHPEIFNTDQGAQFTSEEFTGILKDAKVQISMDGRGRALDNVFIERLWWSVKYEEVYLNEYESVEECRTRIGAYLNRYNEKRIHSSLNYRIPAHIYFEGCKKLPVAV